jgi:tetratricopeptide (TPR) repeat protein
MREFKIVFFLAAILAMGAPLMLFEFSSIKISSAFAQTNDQCTEQLILAEKEYFSGKYAEAIELINQCLDKTNLIDFEKEKAYKILSLVYISMDSINEANNAVKNLLITNPNFKAVPDRDPQTLQIFIDYIAQTLTPEINFITPSSRMQNGNEFTMTVNGLNFTHGSEVRFNGNGKLTTFISDTILLAKIPATDMINDGEYEITVYSPILKGRTSNSKRFEVESSSMSLWKWFATGGAAIAIVVSTILLLEPDPDVKPIAEPPGRP